MLQRLLLAAATVGFGLGTWAEIAEAQHFGRNKVQYRAFDFQVIETEHFDIYFYEDEREAALDAARMAERSYARLSRILQHEFEERKSIIIYASHTEFQQTNVLPTFIDEGTQAFAEPMRDRIVIPLNPSYADFDHVLRHELAHAFQFDVMFRRGGYGGESGPFAQQPPLWFMEGMAEYLARGHIDPSTVAWLRDGVLSGYLRSIEEMSQRHDFLSYRFGQSLWAYIGDKWGDEVIGILLQRAPRLGIARAFRTTLGLSLGELSQEWLGEVRTTYLMQSTEYVEPEAFAERLTDHDELGDPSYMSPAISPDGKHMTYMSQRGGFFPDLWLADARTGEAKKRLIESGGDSNFESLRYANSSAAFSPNGRYLAFTAQSGGREVLHIYDIERGRMDKTLRFELNGVGNPSWSPDGQYIAFTGIDGGISDLFITDMRGELRRLTNDRHAALLPAWSPDGSTIAFTTDRGSDTDFDRLTYGNLRVALYYLASDEIQILPHQDEGKNENAAWAPDGRSLVWVSDRDDTNNLYLFDLDQQELFQITDVLSGMTGISMLSPSPVLSWAKDDGRLLFAYFEEAGYNIYAVDDPRDLPRSPVIPEAERRPPVVAEAPPETPPVGAEPADTALTSVAAVSSFYREGDGFRPSSAIPRLGQIAPPVSVQAMLEDPEFALPDVQDFKVRDYSAKLSPDMIGQPTIGAQVGGGWGSGVHGGSFISLSDMLGNHNLLLAANLGGSLSDAMFFSGYQLLKHRPNFGVAMQQVPYYGYETFNPGGPQEIDGVTRPVVADVLNRYVYRVGQAMVSYPFSTFRRLEFGLDATQIQIDRLFIGYYADTGEPLNHSERMEGVKWLAPRVSLVFDNSLFGWTGPIAGRRYRLSASTRGGMDYSDVMIDFRNYINIKQRVVIATRLTALTAFGADAHNFGLFWGGPYFLRGYDAQSFSQEECERSAAGGSIGTCPVAQQLVGSSAAVVSLETRFPIITELQLGAMRFPPIDAVLFADGGMAWDPGVCTEADSGRYNFGCDTVDVEVGWSRSDGQDPLLFRRPLFSYGGGIRFNIFYGVLSFDYVFPVNRPDKGGHFSFSFGPSF